MNEAFFQDDNTTSSRIIYTPSDFAKLSLLYLQEIGTLTATKPHINSRINLSSYLFFMVNSGEGTLTYNGEPYRLKAGDCVFIDCRRPYSHATSDNYWSLSWIHFNGPTAGSIYQKYRERGGLPSFRPSEFSKYRAIYEHLYKIASSNSFTKDMDINTIISSLLSALMSDSWHPDKAHPGAKKTNMLEIRKYLDENYPERIALSDLSQRYHINKFYLTRVFKEQFGVSVMDYLLSVRITEAKNLLRFTQKSAEEIGMQCGIGDVYYFSRIFKKIEGIGIREYRKQWK